MEIKNICKLKDLKKKELEKILPIMLNKFTPVGVQTSELYLQQLEKEIAENKFINLIFSESDNTIYYIFELEERTVAMTFESILDVWYGYVKMLLETTGKNTTFKNPEVRTENIYNYIKELNEKRKEC